MAHFDFTGAVLAGGQSRRMGTNKAFIALHDRWLISYGLDALADANQRFIVGGTDPRLAQAAEAAGALWIEDLWPGEGPLGGVVTALGQARHPVTVLLPCDLPGITSADVNLLVVAVQGDEALGDENVHRPVAAVFSDGQRQHYLPVALSAAAGRVAQRLFNRGQRSMASLFAELTVVEVPGSPGATADIDTPEDLDRF